MGFNIQGYIERFKGKLPEHSDKKIIQEVLIDIIPDLTLESIHVHAGLLRLRGVPLVSLTRLRLKKKGYIKKINDRGVHLRDII